MSSISPPLKEECPKCEELVGSNDYSQIFPHSGCDYSGNAHVFGRAPWQGDDNE